MLLPAVLSMPGQSSALQRLLCKSPCSPTCSW
jgi:hypothetical protein